MISKTFWQDVEKELKYVLYSDTDSLFIHIPSVDSNNIENCISKSTEIANNINGLIRNYLDATLLPKMHVDPQYNFTEFKNEFTCNAIMFLDVKKNYSYSMTSKEGKIYNPPSIEYTGIPVVKSNTSEFSREFLIELINTIALNRNLEKKDIISTLSDLAKRKNEYLNQQLKNGNFKYFATPVKWGDKEYAKESANIIGMRLYNSITGQDIFKPLSSGLLIPIEIKNNQKIRSLDLTNPWGINQSHLNTLNFVCLPYNYDTDQVNALFKEYSIEIISDLWGKLTEAKIIQKIVNLIKDHAKK